MAELQIIGVPQSNFVWTTRIACEEKGVAYTLIPVRPHTPEVDAIHPFGKIPVMRHGAVTLCESRAILCYIDHAFDGPPLVPSEPAGRALTEQWLSLLNTEIDPLAVRRYLVAYLFPGTPDGSPDRAVIDAALPALERQLGVLERAVAATGHLVGDRFTLADLDLVPMLFYLNKAPESGAMIGRLAGLKAYLERHLARPSVRETLPPPLPDRRAAA
jgi:glutathione S-transferase